MSIIWTLLVGLVVGFVAKLLMPGRDPGGFIITMLLGVAGSFLAGYGGRLAGLYRPGETPGFIMSVLGAIVLLLIYRMIQKRRTA